ncbi:hypothetical protein FNU77_23035 [Prescottella equi]|nr:hypothetical protein C7H75_03795 [Prescottella equi]QDP12381.1 hypothetical protein FNU77_23035 [Prescottella equi]
MTVGIPRSWARSSPTCWPRPRFPPRSTARRRLRHPCAFLVAPATEKAHGCEAPRPACGRSARCPGSTRPVRCVPA